jgi:hypothetical protein
MDYKKSKKRETQERHKPIPIIRNRFATNYFARCPGLWVMEKGATKMCFIATIACCDGQCVHYTWAARALHVISCSGSLVSRGRGQTTLHVPHLMVEDHARNLPCRVRVRVRVMVRARIRRNTSGGLQCEAIGRGEGQEKAQPGGAQGGKYKASKTHHHMRAPLTLTLTQQNPWLKPRGPTTSCRITRTVRDPTRTLTLTPTLTLTLILIKGTHTHTQTNKHTQSVRERGRERERKRER